MHAHSSQYICPVVHPVIILGRPLPLKRPRLGKWGVYDSQKQVKAQFAFAARDVMAAKNIPMLRGQIELHVWFNFEFPLIWTDEKREKAIRTGSWHTNVPDTSNLLKFVEDALNGILWEDDSMICSITAIKKYKKQSSTVIYAWEIPNDTQMHK
jgi:Holliday junction resolvase RusA-like endonuclease